MALDIGTWGFILDSVYEHGGGSVGGNSFIAFARKKGAVEEVNLSPFIYLNVGLVSGFSCMFNFEDWLVLY